MEPLDWGSPGSPRLGAERVFHRLYRTWRSVSRGRTVVDRSGRSGRDPNARVAVDVDTAAFVRLLIERLRTLG